MRSFLEVAGTGLTAGFLHPIRSMATIGCLVVILTPHLTGLGVSRGVQAEAEASIRHGPDLYVSGDQFGRPAPVPLEAVGQIQKMDGVSSVTPRIVGSVTLGKAGETAVVVGLPPKHFPPEFRCVAGRFPEAASVNEFVVGAGLARRLKLEVGSVIPPFYRNDQGERLSVVVGIFDSDVSLWASTLVLTTFDSAAAIFNQHGLATDLLVNCLPGHQDAVALRVQGLVLPQSGQGTVRLRATSREDLQAMLPGGVLHREGIFNLFFVLLFVGGTLVVLVTSGFGLSERRREVGILRAIGWQTEQVLVRSSVESLALAFIGASVSFLLAYLWLAGLDGFGLASLFHGGSTEVVPYRVTSTSFLIALAIACTVVMTGTLYSSWRAAITPPRDAMR
jgi:ABC-type lipoprotein release transport system permease subunit